MPNKVKKLLQWCVKRTSSVLKRSPTTAQLSPHPRRLEHHRRTATVATSTPSMEPNRGPHRHSESSRATQRTSTDTLVETEDTRPRAFSDSLLAGGSAEEYDQNVYTYFPWSEAEHEEILSRCPSPECRPHYQTFPSLVEMGGLLSLH